MSSSWNREYILLVFVMLLPGCAISPAAARVSWLNGSVVKDDAGVIVGVSLSRGVYVPYAGQSGTWTVVGDPPIFGDHATVDDDSLASLKRFPQLSWINLTGTDVNGSGLRHVPNPLLLRKLDLTATAITDDGLRSISRFGKLTELRLSGTLITDGGLHHLSQIKSLEELSLDDTVISDAGIEILSALPNLETIYLRDTRITPSGIKRLQESKPQLRVVTERQLGGII